MSEEKKTCSGDCSHCSSKCGEPESLFEPQNKLSNVKKVIGVVSGKGGVGKSTVSTALSVLLRRKGYEVGVLDADITGPSVPKAFGISGSVEAAPEGMFPRITETGIKIMSVNLLLENTDAPVVWRGPVIAGAVKQFWTDVIWGNVDFMIVDCPPGTGDVPLTVFQSIKLDGIIIVTSPQDLVSMIVKKAYKMAELMNIPVLGIVENMSYAVCPCCNEKINIFGSGKTGSVADEIGTELLARMPIDPSFSDLVDCGRIEDIKTDALDGAVEKIESLNN